MINGVASISGAPDLVFLCSKIDHLMYLLLIEESCPIAERLTELFSSHPKITGFLSVKATGFNTALMNAFIPDIVLLGVTYPLATSFGLLTRVATELCPSALIMLDSGTDDYIHQHFLRNGATHVVDVYNDFGELLHIVNRVAAH